MGEVLCEVHANPTSDIKGALALLNTCFTVTAGKPAKPELIKYVIE